MPGISDFSLESWFYIWNKIIALNLTRDWRSSALTFGIFWGREWGAVISISFNFVVVNNPSTWPSDSAWGCMIILQSFTAWFSEFFDTCCLLDQPTKLSNGFFVFKCVQLNQFRNKLYNSTFAVSLTLGPPHWCGEQLKTFKTWTGIGCETHVSPFTADDITLTSMNCLRPHDFPWFLNGIWTHPGVVLTHSKPVRWAKASTAHSNSQNEQISASQILDLQKSFK